MEREGEEGDQTGEQYSRIGRTRETYKRMIQDEEEKRKKCLKIKPKILRDFLQIKLICMEKEREGERVTPRYLKKNTRSIGELEIYRGGREFIKEELER